MSTVVVLTLSAIKARALTDQIKTGVEAVWQLIVQAYEQRADIALGYESWDDYCTREFGTSRIRLPREERAEVVASLRESGMSIRAIVAATGAAYNTVLRDVTQTESVEPIIGLNGKTYKPHPTPCPKPEPTTESDPSEVHAMWEADQVNYVNALIEQWFPDAVVKQLSPKAVRYMVKALRKLITRLEKQS